MVEKSTTAAHVCLLSNPEEAAEMYVGIVETSALAAACAWRSWRMRRQGIVDIFAVASRGAGIQAIRAPGDGMFSAIRDKSFNGSVFGARDAAHLVVRKLFLKRRIKRRFLKRRIAR